MNDQEILAYYTQAYNRARQTGGGGRETPHQIAHVQALKALVALGDGEGVITHEELPLRVQPEDKGVAHQRRLSFAAHWLNEGGRRQRIAAQPTFTHVTDAFAAGGLYEREYLAGEVGVEERAGHMLTQTESTVHERLSAANGMEALLGDLFEIVGAETPEELVGTIEALVSGGAEVAPALPPVLNNEPFVAELDPGNYAWCSCGMSQNQPFCDGSHKGTEDTPVMIKLKKKTKVALCQCKETGTPPYCDGSHEALEADEASAEGDAEPNAEPDAGAAQ